MKTVVQIETTKPIGIRELNGFLTGIAQRMPGCFVSQGPSSRGRLTVVVLAPAPLELEVAEEVLESLPHLCDSIAGLSLGEPARRSAA
ncbi:hypothetical protein MN205_05080 [Kineococcus sp. TRM81007]|uniref:hypothetical protein n=1 Tax=Kineococcus sp. TRM81007 TaxID=2925831 RepID=UPI001F561221|nr:hypothetical protein [Kineococcus sp. TRM81007]MCI2237863.1 hypothetical protein [Kineococcus sp. TRM81007]